MKNNKLLWRLCVAAAILIIILTFSPLVIAPGKTTPSLFGMPYTLWVSILTTIALVVLTYLGSKVLPDEEEDNQ